jgi:D-lactate dehydrogenase (cytochrome)
MRRSDAPQIIEQYCTDEGNAFHAQGVDCVVFPETTEDVRQVLRNARENATPVTVSAGGTGITGGRVATRGGIVLTVEAMRDAAPRQGFEAATVRHEAAEYTLQLDRAERLAWCPAGLTLQALDELLAPDLLFPPAPTEQSATISGAVATDASGGRSFHWGPTREWVEALEVVLPDGDSLTVARGDVIADGRALCFTGDSGQSYAVLAPSYDMPPTKNAAGLHAEDGMDLVDLFVGCEGILGVVTEVCVRLADRPQLVGDVAFFGDEEAALAHADALREAARSGMPIVAIEYFDAASLRFMADQPFVSPDHQGAVYAEVAADDFAAIEALAEIIEQSDPPDDWFADEPSDHEEQRTFRHALPEGVNTWIRRHGSGKLGTDFAVPAEAFDEMMATYRAAGRAFEDATGRDGPHHALFGHLGDYHLHLNFLVAGEQEREVARGLYADLARTAVDLGGTISAEHGVGKKQIHLDGRDLPYLEVMFGADGVREIARCKASLDPECLLNPDNMIPREMVQSGR